MHTCRLWEMLWCSGHIPLVSHLSQLYIVPCVHSSIHSGSITHQPHYRISLLWWGHRRPPTRTTGEYRAVNSPRGIQTNGEQEAQPPCPLARQLWVMLYTAPQSVPSGAEAPTDNWLINASFICISLFPFPLSPPFLFPVFTSQVNHLYPSPCLKFFWENTNSDANGVCLLQGVFLQIPLTNSS